MPCQGCSQALYVPDNNLASTIWRALHSCNSEHDGDDAMHRDIGDGDGDADTDEHDDTVHDTGCAGHDYDVSDADLLQLQPGAMQ